MDPIVVGNSKLHGWNECGAQVSWINRRRNIISNFCGLVFKVTTWIQCFICQITTKVSPPRNALIELSVHYDMAPM